jgi:hypothetical protein
VEVVGWYRRSIIPYVEIYRMKIGGKWKQLYTTWVYYAALAAFMIIGALVMWAGFIFI